MNTANTEWCERCGNERAADDGEYVCIREATGPSYASAGDPPEYAWICYYCLDQDDYPEPDEEALWAERARYEIDWEFQQEGFYED